MKESFVTTCARSTYVSKLCHIFGNTCINDSTFILGIHGHCEKPFQKITELEYVRYYFFILGDRGQKGECDGKYAHSNFVEMISLTKVTICMHILLHVYNCGEKKKYVASYLQHLLKLKLY